MRVYVETMILSGSSLQSSMALARRLIGNRKGLRVGEEALLPAPPAPRGQRRPCNHTDTAQLNTHFGHLDVVTVFTEDTDLITCIILMLPTPGGA